MNSLRLTIALFVLAAALAPALLVSWHHADASAEIQAAPASIAPVVPQGFKTAPWEGVSKPRSDAPPATPARSAQAEPKQPAATAPQTPQPAATSPQTTVLVELFTSEGCSSCPAADKVLAELAAAAPADGNVFFLAYHVDYWDKLGWKDRFASSAYTERQRTYAKAFDTDSVYTPQTVVNGKLGFVGSDKTKTQEAIAAAKADKPTLTLTATHAVPINPDQTVKVEAKLVPVEGQKLPSNIKVFAVLTENGLSTQVKRGENEGRTLKHAHVVRALVEATPSETGAATIEIKVPSDLKPDNAMVVVFVQDSQTMRVLGAAQVKH